MDRVTVHTPTLELIIGTQRTAEKITSEYLCHMEISAEIDCNLIPEIYSRVDASASILSISVPKLMENEKSVNFQSTKWTATE